MYIKTPGAASNAIVDELGECGSKYTRGHAAASCMSQLQLMEHRFKPEEMEKMWRDYFVFGFVENPWRRAYDAFSYMQGEGVLLT
jgi:hypothetical protein